ncbi:MAG: hypothetical protein AMXMBFR64_22810 [Myxococcales bacterium]
MLPGLLFLALLGGCKDSPPTTDQAPTTTTGALTAPAERPLPAFAGLLLDVDGDRILVGTPLPAPENADPMMEMTVRLLVRGVPTPWPLDDRPLSHARLLPGGALGITMRGDLVVADATVTRVDGEAIGPVGASADGRTLVYCKGEAPSLEVWRADYDGGWTTRPVTTAMAPTWSPAVSGDSVVYASAHSGVAALWRADGGAPRQLTNRDVTFTPGQAPHLDPFPASLTPTLFDGDRIVFEGEQGVVVMTGEGRVLRQETGRVPHRLGLGYGVVRGNAIHPLEVAP